MKTVSLQKLDAFTTGKSTGNPAALVVLADAGELNREEMQQLAYELRGFVSEVGYVWPSAQVDFELRYFSCEKEVPFCGHATVAILHRLIKTRPEIFAKKELLIQTSRECLKVFNRVPEDDLVFIHAPAPVTGKTGVSHAQLAEALNVPVAMLDRTKSPALLNVGQDILLVGFADASACIECRPDYGQLRQFALANNCEIITIYTTDTVYPENHLRTRVFAPTFGYLEDPATGSGNSALGYHLQRTGLWDGGAICIEQGPDRQTPNIIHLRFAENRVLIGGGAVCRLEANYYLQ